MGPSFCKDGNQQESANHLYLQSSFNGAILLQGWKSAQDRRLGREPRRFNGAILLQGWKYQVFQGQFRQGVRGLLARGTRPEAGHGPEVSFRFSKSQAPRLSRAASGS